MLTWRLLLGLGALPAAGVIYLRAKMPESPRFTAQVSGEHTQAAADAAAISGGVVGGEAEGTGVAARLGLRDLLGRWPLLKLVLGTAGTWFLFDYADYGNTLSLPAILKAVDPHATLMAKLAWTLGSFVVFAVPGYPAAISEWTGSVIAGCSSSAFPLVVAFFALGAIHVLTASVGLFVAVFGVSYFFVEFGPNTMTFVMPSEVFPVSVRTTGHGIAAGIGKLGAFVGVFVVPQLQKHIGLRGMLVVAGCSALMGLMLTRLLPEPALQSIDEL